MTRSGSDLSKGQDQKDEGGEDGIHGAGPRLDFVLGR